MKNSTTPLLKFPCSHCHQVLEVDEPWAGHEVNCPTCGQPVVVPVSPPNSAPVAKLPSHPKPPAPKNDKVSSEGGGFGKFLLLVLLLAVAGFGVACYQSWRIPPSIRPAIG